MKLVRAAVERPVGVGVLSAAVVLFGVVAADLLAVDLLPSVDFPRVSILTRYEGVGPEEIENLLTRPIERAVATLNGVTAIEGTSSEGMSRVSLRFEWGANLDAAIADVRAYLDRLRDALPPDAAAPVVYKFDLAAAPIATLGLSGGADPRRLRALADELLTRRLERIEGVALVEVRGGRVREFRVALSAAAMMSLGVTSEEVVAALARENRNVSAGDAREAGREVLVRVVGELRDADDIAEVIVAAAGGDGQSGGAIEPRARPVRVRDLGEVIDGFQDIESEQWVDGEPGIVLRVSKQSGSNTVDVTERLEAEIEAINRDYAGRVRVAMIQNGGDYIRTSVTNVRDSALLGAILAVFVLLAFLRDLRATAVIALAIPFSVMATFALMYFLGFTLNLISFGGLALGIGMLVDNAIVILENIHRLHREEGLEAREAAVLGAAQVAPAVVAGTLTTMAVFVPVVFLGGFAGIFFVEMAAVVVFSLACSLLVSVTLVPALAARLMGRGGSLGRLGAAVERVFGGGLGALERGYLGLLRGALRQRWLTAAVFGVWLVGGVRMAMELDVELMPETDEGLVDVDVELPMGTPIDVTRRVVKELERRIRETVRPEEIANVVSSAGPENPYRPGGAHEGEVEVTLVPVSGRARGSAEIMQGIRAVTSGIPGADVRVRQRTTNPLQRLMRGRTGERLAVDIRGHDTETAGRLAERISEAMRGVPGISDVRSQRAEGLAERVVRVDWARAADLGVQRGDAAAQVETYLLGREATRVRDGGVEVAVRVRLRDEDRADVSQLLGLPIMGARGVVPLGAIAEAGGRRGPGSIDREGQERVLTVTAGFAGRPAAEVMADVEAAIGRVPQPDGFSVTLGGEAVERDSAFEGLGTGVGLAVLLVFAVMAVQFESVRRPLLVISTLPFGFVGVSGALWITGTTFNLNAFLGAIVLVGIVVNNAIVLVDTTAQIQRDDALSGVDAIVEAGRRRVRPILMTTLTTILAMLPIAAGMGEGGEIQAPLARVVFGGLLFGTVVSLVLLPVLQAAAEKRAENRTERAFTEVVDGSGG